MTVFQTLNLKPQTRRILAHLRSRGTISPMEAFSDYGNTRLAAAIYDLRQAGFNIETQIRKSPGNHTYARYSMKTKMAS